jgi:hypothetical protein
MTFYVRREPALRDEHRFEAWCAADAAWFCPPSCDGGPLQDHEPTHIVEAPYIPIIVSWETHCAGVCRIARLIHSLSVVLAALASLTGAGILPNQRELRRAWTASV